MNDRINNDVLYLQLGRLVESVVHAGVSNDVDIDLSRKVRFEIYQYIEPDTAIIQRARLITNSRSIINEMCIR